MSSASERVRRRIDLLDPITALKCLRFLAVASDQGIPLRVTDTHRTFQEQEALFAQGRRTREEVNQLRIAAGMPPLKAWERNAVVTRARPGFSLHNFGKAFDVVPMRMDHQALKAAPEWASPFWNTLGEIAKDVGLVWGGTFTKPDRPHFQDVDDAD